MRHIVLLICSSTVLGSVLSGCATKPSTEGSSTHRSLHLFGKKSAKSAPIANSSTLPSVDLSKPPGIKQQYFVGGFSNGAWVNHTAGSLFEPVAAHHPQAAIVYFYRLNSRWNRQEIVAPNFFLNGKRIPSLINNQYYWIELPAGSYRLTTSRPVGVLHFQKPKPADFSVEAGQTYYLKYEEQAFRGAPDASLGLLRVGPLMQMPSKQGLAEVRTTTLKTPGISFVPYQKDTPNQPLEVNVHDDRYQKVPKSALTPKTEPVLGIPFKIWNPLTW